MWLFMFSFVPWKMSSKYVNKEDLLLKPYCIDLSEYFPASDIRLRDLWFKISLLSPLFSPFNRNYIRKLSVFGDLVQLHRQVEEVGKLLKYVLSSFTRIGDKFLGPVFLFMSEWYRYIWTPCSDIVSPSW